MLGDARVVELDGVRVDLGADRLTITAERSLTGIATKRFSAPSTGVVWSRGGFASGIEFVGFAFTQFALPVTGGRDLDFDFAPAPGLTSPRVMSPLIARAGSAVMLLAPIDQFHEQVIAVTDGGLAWGWHGDLDEVPEGFSCALGVYRAGTVAEALTLWRRDLAIEHVDRATDNALSTHLSYWTDNGAAYWYRTEPGTTIADSVAAAVADLRARDVPIGSVELDSWAYRHETARPITEIGYPDEVPPTGMIEWSPRADAFLDVGAGEPGDRVPSIREFAERVDLPLSMHARHISPVSPYVDSPDDWWVDELAAHPKDPSFFRRWFDDAARWGVTCIEQDWMLMYWFGVRQLRAAPDRAAGWQRALNDHASATGVDLLWCMATPADLMLAASLDRVIAVRTCDDYRFAEDPALLWTWFLTVNRLANTLGLPAFKDCFFTESHVGASDDAIDGDPHAELEAALAALSGGPVGIGDRIGRTNRDLVMRTCDDDGRLRSLDGAVAAIDRCLFGGPERGDGLMWATTTATRDGIVWTHVLAINTASDAQTIADRFELDGDRVVYRWRDGGAETTSFIEVELGWRDWALFVVGPSDASVAGDATKYVVVEASVA